MELSRSVSWRRIPYSVQSHSPVSMLTTLAVANYRSLCDLVLPLGQLNIITGANGSGKSSVYRALRLLAETAQGRIITALAREGGLQSTLWAGPEEISRAMRAGEVPIQGTRRRKPSGLKLGFSSDALGYLIQLGLPNTLASAFQLDPEIKCESIWAGAFLRRASQLIDRTNAIVKLKQGKGWDVLDSHLAGFDSMLTQLADPHNAPEMLQLREQVRSWRFYDHFRTDADAPARRPQIGTLTTCISDDGHDLAAALQTIIEIGDAAGMAEAVDDAFPGATLEIDTRDGRFEVQMRQPGLLRPLNAAELSDGTLRYLLLVAALYSPRPAELLVLNEPETSLHPDLLPALGRLIRKAAAHSQVIVVSHANRLIATLREHEDCQEFCLEKAFGQTRVMGLRELDRPAWHWEV